MQEVLAPFYAEHPDIDVHLVPAELPTSQIVTGILSGQQMDIIYDNYFAPYYQQQLVVPLEPYFKRNQVDPAIWNPAQFALYNTPQGPMGVPVYTGTSVFALNLGLFDQFGVPYPDQNWTYQQYTALLQALTRTGPTPVVGGNIFWWSWGPSQQASWVFRAFGGHQVSPGGPPSQLSSGPNLAALTWLYEDLFWPRIAVPQDVANWTQFVQGRLGVLDMDTWNLLTFALALRGTAVKFDFWPYPIFPAGRATFCTADFYAIAANSRSPDACWELLRWVSVDPTWQRATFKYALRSPALNSLWEEWATTVQTVVPFFHGKDFRWFGEAAAKGYAYPVEYYPQADEQVWSLLAPYFTALYRRQSSDVTSTARAIDQVVNAVEAQAASLRQAQQAMQTRFPTAGPAMATVPAGV
jgi:multiple sugar transport system substrate-binding protein